MRNDTKIAMAGFGSQLRTRLQHEEERRAKKPEIAQTDGGTTTRDDMNYTKEERIQAMKRAVSEADSRATTPSHSFNDSFTLSSTPIGPLINPFVGAAVGARGRSAQARPTARSPPAMLPARAVSPIVPNMMSAGTTDSTRTAPIVLPARAVSPAVSKMVNVPFVSNVVAAAPSPIPVPPVAIVAPVQRRDASSSKGPPGATPKVMAAPTIVARSTSAGAGRSTGAVATPKGHGPSVPSNANSTRSTSPSSWQPPASHRSLSFQPPPVHHSHGPLITRPGVTMSKASLSTRERSFSPSPKPLIASVGQSVRAVTAPLATVSDCSRMSSVEPVDAARQGAVAPLRKRHDSNVSSSSFHISASHGRTSASVASPKPAARNVMQLQAKDENDYVRQSPPQAVAKAVPKASEPLLHRAEHARASLMNEVEKTRAIIKRLQEQASDTVRDLEISKLAPKSPPRSPAQCRRSGENSKPEPRSPATSSLGRKSADNSVAGLGMAAVSAAESITEKQKGNAHVMSALRVEVERVHNELLVERHKFESWQTSMTEKLSAALNLTPPDCGVYIGSVDLTKDVNGSLHGNGLKNVAENKADSAIDDDEEMKTVRVPTTAPFCSQVYGSNISLSDDGYTARRVRGVRESIAIGSAPLESHSCGNLYFEVEIIETVSGWVGGLGIGVTHTSPQQLERPPERARWIPRTFIAGYEGCTYLGAREWSTRWQTDRLRERQRVGCLISNDDGPEMVIFVDSVPVLKVDSEALKVAGFVKGDPLHPLVDIFSATMCVCLVPRAQPPGDWQAHPIEDLGLGVSPQATPRCESAEAGAEDDELTNREGKHRNLASSWAAEFIAAQKSAANNKEVGGISPAVA